MEKVIVLIGTNHQFQFGGNLRTVSENANFESFVKSTCQHYKAKLLAEEMNLDALEINGRKQSTVSALALDLGIAHVYCDPSQDEQTKMELCVERNELLFQALHGWTQDRIDEAISIEHQKRERFWLSKIFDQNIWPVVFVCGAKHIKTFHALLHTHGIYVHLVAENWGEA